MTASEKPRAARRWCGWCHSMVQPFEAETAAADVIVDLFTKDTRVGARATHELPIDVCPHCGNKTAEHAPDKAGALGGRP